MKTELRHAFSGWYSAAALLASSFALISIAVRVLDLGLTSVLASMLRWYREIIHGLMNFVPAALGLHIAPMACDVLAAWLLVGGLFVRTGDFYFRKMYPRDLVAAYQRKWDDTSDRQVKLKTRLGTYIVLLILWPGALFAYYALMPKGYHRDAFPVPYLWLDDKRVKEYFDLRIVFLIYFVALALAFTAFFALNAALPSIT